MSEFDALKARFDTIDANLKRRYDLHRLIRRAGVAFLLSSFIFGSFVFAFLEGLNAPSLISCVLGIATFFISGAVFASKSVKRHKVKRYSRLFVQKPRLSLAIFALENFIVFAFFVFLVCIFIVSSMNISINSEVGIVFEISVFLWPLFFIAFLACFFANKSMFCFDENFV
ncbi:hypothetical protein [Campylobacter curvus]|uniref:hypothetical protein n=1 Tax=Campylobacter curvus TaxID=200 RepID=UPI00038073BF|nr:hypothetical protein [Campylobacter curvus]QKF60569.1 putative membrane protein [Campylobacter curvus]UEB50716.1 hypothetical protein LK426_04510 [Campylobacter curvus]